MPQVIGTIGAAAIGATFAVAVSTTSTIAILAGLGTIALGAAALRALTPKPTIKTSGYNVTSRGSALDHQVVYGKTRVAGVEVFKATTGTDNAYLHLVLAFTGHEIESFEEIWINDEKATLDGNGNVTTVTTEEGVTSDRYNNKLTIIKRLGGTDNATPPVFGSSPNTPADAGWTSVHKLTGISYLYCRLKFDRDAFPNGVPEIQATIKGKKVYNPDTAITEWSDNPALCIRDYLTTNNYGLGEDTSAIDDTLFIAAAEACDAAATYSQSPTIWGSSVTIGAKKYTLNGAFTTAAKPADVIEDMLTSMGGTLWYAQGKWRVKAAKWYPSSLSLDEDDLRSGMTINTRHSSRDNFNVIKGTFRGVESNYIETDYQQFPKDDSLNSFITVDNGQKSVIDIPLAFTSDSVTARRLARIALERHRQQLTISATFGMRAFNVQVGDVVSLTNTRMGWTNKTFEVVGWTFTTGQDLELLVEMTLRETSETVFDEEDDGVIYERDNTTLFSPFFVPSVSLDSPFSSNSMNSDGTAVPFIDFAWTPTDPSRIDYYVFEWSTDAGVTYNPTTTSGTTFRLSPTETGKTYLYRVTPYNYLGVKGTTVTSAVGIAATADGTTPNAPTSLSASGGYRTATVTWTEPTTNTDASSLTDLKYYRVYRGTSTNPTTEVGVTFSNIFTDGGLADGTQYYYRVKAVDRTGNESAYSTETNVTTNAQLTDGVDGIDGNSVALLSVYKRGATAPSTPTGGSFNFGTTTLTPPTGWSTTPPAGSDPLYVANANASIQGTTGTDSSLVWSTPQIFTQNGADGINGTDGVDGQDGTSVTILGSLASTGDLPASGNTQGDAYLIGGDLYVWDGSSWNNVGTIQGPAGTEGKSVYTAIVFQRSASAPSTPTGGSFNFGTNTLTPPTGWYLDVPSGTDPAWGTRAVFSVSGDTGTDSSPTWSASFKIAEDGIDGLDGADGADGLSVFLASVFKRSATAPSTPTGGSYNFGTNTLTAPTDWSSTPPAGSDPLYVANANANIQGTTGTDSSLSWSSPALFVQDGADGLDGNDGGDGKSVYTAIVFNRYSTAPSAPTGGSFNFGTNTLTAPSGWLLDIPTGTDPIYGTRAVFSIIGDTGTSSNPTWSTPFKVAEDGADGLDGNDGADGLSTFLASVFKRSASAPSTPAGGSYNFGTNTLTAPSGWSTTVPAGDSPVYLSNALASVQGVTGTDSSLSWTAPAILAENGVDGADGINGTNGTDGERGAGRWYIGVTSLPTTSSGADADFTAAIGNPVDRDQAWFYEGTVANPTAQNVWIYTAGTDTWTVQEEFIDGNLVVAGTITGDKINTNAITADKIQAGAVNADKMTIDGELVLGNDAGFIAGRSFNSAYEDDGFFVGRETRADGTQGFELSTSSVNGNNELTGIIHNEQDHLKIFNPVLLIGGNVSGGVDTYASTQTVDLGVNTGRTITVTAYGGGGGGGGGHDDRGDNEGGTGAQGGTTVVKIYHTSTSSESNLITTVTASGGAGGQSGGGGRGAYGTNGGATPFGSGGAGGFLNSAGGDANSAHYGAGGGGAGGDASGLFDNSGAAGLGGLAATPVIENISITQTTNIYAVITAIGSGGAGDTTGVSYYGGDGAPGAVSISSVFGGTYALPAKEITPMDIWALADVQNKLIGNYLVQDLGVEATTAVKSNSQDVLWIFSGWSNAVTNGDWWLGGSGRIITQWGYEGQLPNSNNYYNWNERDFIASPGTNYYRSSNSYASIPVPAMMYFEAGTWMDTDRSAIFQGVRFITEANIPTGYSVEDIARIYLRNLKDYNH